MCRFRLNFNNIIIYSKKPYTGITLVNPHTPVVQKVADEVVFRRFQGEGVEFFFKSDVTDPLRFLMSIFLKIPILVLPAFIFQ